MLARVRNLGQGAPPIPAETSFGVPTLKKGDCQWNAAKCIYGEPNAAQLLPDRDLGTTVRKECRNVVRCPEDENRTFGCPTIRTDIPARKMKSVADH